MFDNDDDDDDDDDYKPILVESSLKNNYIMKAEEIKTKNYQ